MSLQSRIDYSIDLLRKAEPLALKMHPEGFHLAFSATYATKQKLNFNG